MKSRVNGGIKEIQCNKCLGWFVKERLCKDVSQSLGVKPVCKTCYNRKNRKRKKKIKTDNPDPVARKILEDSSFWNERE